MELAGERREERRHRRIEHSVDEHDRAGDDEEQPQLAGVHAWTVTAAARERGRGRGEALSGSDTRALVAELGPPAHDVLLELGPHRVVQWRLFVALDRGSPDLRRSRGRVLG